MNGLISYDGNNTSVGSNDFCLHVVEPHRGRSFIWQIGVNSGPSSSRSRFFMESSQSCAATLTHYSTEPMTTGPAYDPLLLLLDLAGDVHLNRTQDRQGTLLGLLQERHWSRGQQPVYKMLAFGTIKMFWTSKCCGLS